MAGKFPKPYADSVPEKPDPMMEMTSLPVMGIGARPSGLPKGDVSGVKSLEHVGGALGKKG